MRFALYSDLHLKFQRDGLWIPPALDVDVVILAGDIAKHTEGIEWATTAFRQAPSSPEIVYLAGNHEDYGDDYDKLLAQFTDPHWKNAGVHFLERATFERPGVRILGCTLWSAFDLYGADEVDAYMGIARNAINDYRVVRIQSNRTLTPADTRCFHHNSVAWLDAELAKPFDGKTVVVTHFAPHRDCVAPEHRGTDFSPYFVTDLAWLMEKHRIDVWCHGHTHTNNDFVAENGCRVIANQLGYPYERSAGFRPDLVVDV